MRRFVTLIICCILYNAALQAQPCITIATGFSKDINNRNETFDHIPVSLQWKPSPFKNTAFFIKVDYDIPVSGTATGYAYTLNPSLPPEVNLQESIRPYIFTASLGWRIHLFNTSKNSFYIDLLPLGVCNQSITVSYKNYDKANYDILNPDISIHYTSLVASAGIVYRMPLEKERNSLLFMLHVQSALLDNTGKYALSYKFIAPLQLTVGYNFNYNRKK